MSGREREYQDDYEDEYGHKGKYGRDDEDGDDTLDAYETDDELDQDDTHDEGPDAADSEERTFAALPPAHGRGFAQTWWGRAWLQALEDTALDGEQVKRGRRAAREGAVGAVSVRPGRITAVVRDRDGMAHRSDVLLRELDDDEWDRFLDMAADSAGHIAALLDRDMPPHLVEDAAGLGLELLPGIGDLEPECTCGAWDHCPHTAALCHQVARLLDQDPFVLLLMRGRGERRLLDDLQERSVARAEPAREGARRAGVPAAEAYTAGDILPPLPAPPPLPEAPGGAQSLDTETDPAPGLDPAALEFLAEDAAARARRLLAEALAPEHVAAPWEPSLTVDQDAVRLAAAGPTPWIAARLASGAGRGRAGLTAAAEAWRLGGAAALAVLDGYRPPSPEVLARAKAVLAEAWEAADRPTLRASSHARWTVVGADVQLRLAEDGRWWPFRRAGSQWVPAGPPTADPASALAGVAQPAE
ncbi:SWF or SNF family helicase [Streptomyces sp. NPDC048604]|uniref:SWF or SNF family helicase n=1 Tax=Streptomyces sp. NPDC048604 TaxID=3365578 RepID=UPI00371FFE97